MMMMKFYIINSLLLNLYSSTTNDSTPVVQNSKITLSIPAQVKDMLKDVKYVLQYRILGNLVYRAYTYIYNYKCL